MATKKAQGLRHSLGGAPQTWHTVEGLPGLYHPTKPVSLPVDLATAKKWHEDPGCPVELVAASAAVLEKNAAELTQVRGALMKAVRADRDSAPFVQVDAALAAVNT